MFFADVNIIILEILPPFDILKLFLVYSVAYLFMFTYVCVF